jgi:hypothetical protein
MFLFLSLLGHLNYILSKTVTNSDSCGALRDRIPSHHPPKQRSHPHIPAITILSSAELNGANGAFAATTNTIYLSQEFIANHQENIASITSVILEEIGHWVDSQINTVDSLGDEGAIFSALVQGNSLDDATLVALKTEDDSGIIIIDGEAIAVENAVTPSIGLKVK